MFGHTRPIHRRQRYAIRASRHTCLYLSDGEGSTFAAGVEKYSLNILVFEVGIGAMLDKHFHDFVRAVVIGDEHCEV